MSIIRSLFCPPRWTSWFLKDQIFHLNSSYEQSVKFAYSYDQSLKKVIHQILNKDSVLI